MDDEMRATLRERTVESPIHALQQVAEDLAEKNCLSEDGLLRLSKEIKNVHMFKTILLKAVERLDVAVTENLNSLRILETAHENDQKIEESRKHRDKCVSERNLAVLKLLHLRNTNLVDAAKELINYTDVVKRADAKRLKQRRSPRLHPYETPNGKKKHSPAYDAILASGEKFVSLNVKMNEVAMLVRVLKEL